MFLYLLTIKVEVVIMNNLKLFKSFSLVALTAGLLVGQTSAMSRFASRFSAKPVATAMRNGWQRMPSVRPKMPAKFSESMAELRVWAAGTKYAAKLYMPEFINVSMPKLRLAEKLSAAKLAMPKFNVSMPKMRMPKMRLAVKPRLPKFRLPKFNVSMPKLHVANKMSALRQGTSARAQAMIQALKARNQAIKTSYSNGAKRFANFFSARKAGLKSLLPGSSAQEKAGKTINSDIIAARKLFGPYVDERNELVKQRLQNPSNKTMKVQLKEQIRALDAQHRVKLNLDEITTPTQVAIKVRQA